MQTTTHRHIGIRKNAPVWLYLTDFAHSVVTSEKFQFDSHCNFVAQWSFSLILRLSYNKCYLFFVDWLCTKNLFYKIGIRRGSIGTRNPKCEREISIRFHLPPGQFVFNTKTKYLLEFALSHSFHHNPQSVHAVRQVVTR